MNWYAKAFDRNPVVTGLLTVGAAGAAYWVGRELFAPEKPPRLPNVDLPTGGLGIPSTGIDSKGKPVPWSPAPLASELYDTMEGIDPTHDKEEAWGKVLNLPTSDMVVAVYNYFNSMPKVLESGETLTQWIRDEWGAFMGYKSRLLARLDQLGLA